jgi:hypothetical protein
VNDDVVKLFGVMLAISAPLIVGYLVFCVGQVILRRFGGAGPRAEVQGELEDIRARLAEQEGLSGRVAELEERLDFAERMLARQREQAALPAERNANASR